MYINNEITRLKGRRMKGTPDTRYARCLTGLIVGGVLLASVLITPSASAGFDRLFFSINGDTTLSTMTQGDEFSWGSNCDSGATIHWDIWYDVNSNSVLDPATDFLLSSEHLTDGNLLSDDNPVADGWISSQPFHLSGEPGNYIFKATDIATDSSLQKIAVMMAMSSPPNQFTGQISLPGITAPNALLANRFVFAESDTGDEGAFLAITNSMGMYSMNVGAAGTGVEFYLFPTDVSNYVSPAYVAATASGVVAGVDFTYIAAVDSIWGFVRDELGAIIPYESDISAWSESHERDATTRSGRYVMYFSSADKGDWALEHSSRNSPAYLSPDWLEFSHDTLTSFQHDFTLTRTDAVIYAEITENGGPPANNYRVDAYSASLASWAESVSGTGVNNVVSIYVSSLDPNDWEVSLNQWDEEFQPQAPLIVKSGHAAGISPGDTVSFELVDGKLVGGTITQDPEDAPIIWDEVYVSASDGFNNFDASPDFGGAYALYTDTGSYFMGVYAHGYAVDPAWRNITVTGDTTGSGLGFTINETHALVSGTLVNVALPLDASYYQVIAQTGTDGSDGYYQSATVDSVTGTYQLDLCDGDWTIVPPCCFPDVDVPDSAVVTIGEFPDTARTIDFEYTPVGGTCCIAPSVGDVNQSGDVDITDIQVMIDHQFLTLTPLVCIDEGDINFNLEVDITDLQIMIDSQFLTLTPMPPCP